MKSYSQNQEDLFVIKYFGDYKGTLLEIGANDGQTLSNSRALIENGWSATLVEPGATFKDLELKYDDNPNVRLLNYAIGSMASKLTFYESGNHVPGGKDRGLVSTLDFDETIRWRNNGVQFTERIVDVKPYNLTDRFDFISIDAESQDWTILQQIDLEKAACKCLCVEHNGDVKLKLNYIEYCLKFGLHPKVINNENIIFCL